MNGAQSRHGRAQQSEPFVPIADRVRYLNYYRVIAASVVGLAWLFLPGIRTLQPESFTIYLVGYVVLGLLSALVWKLPRVWAQRLFGLSLLLDGLFLAMVGSTADGSVSPLRYLVFLHVIMVALLAGYRTGVKLAIWHSLLLCMDWQLRRAGFLGGYDAAAAAHDAGENVLVFVLAFTTAALTTAAASAVNERELRRRSYDLDALARLAYRLESRTAPVESAEVLAHAINDEFLLDRVVVLQGGTRATAVLAAVGAGTSHLPIADVIINTGLNGTETILVDRLDAVADPWLTAVLPQAHNLVLIPLRADGETIGLLVVEHGARRGSRIERRLIGVIERFASQTALALANAWLLDHITRLATTDGLTGLLNRRTLDERFAVETARAHATGKPLSTLLIDIDHFKKVNDTYGHAIGDEVLRLVAGTLTATCRPGDVVARYGGEELAVLLPDTAGWEAAEVAERIRAAVGRITEPVPVTVSLGCATLPEHGAHPDALLEAADQALYRAKHNGRNQVQIAGAPTTSSASTMSEVR